MLFPASFIAIALPPWIANYLVWWVCALIVVGGLLIFGWQDVPQMRWRRIWAISSVSFAESLRRRVLWVTPLAILGVIAVSMFQHAGDPQEAIRQTIKYCLFASGLLVTVTAIILACTNLPREIDNRVIYTIVTKPTTRLEIVIGKVLGFARVSGLIVLIMGAFSYAYLTWENWQLSAQVAQRLKIETDPTTRQTLLGYQTAGLLSTRSLDQPADFQTYEHTPAESGYQRIKGYFGYYVLVPFSLTPSDKSMLGSALNDPAHWQALVITTMRLKRNVPTKDDVQWNQSRKIPSEGGSSIGPPLPGQDQGKPVPQITLHVVDWDYNELVPPAEINGGKMAAAILENHTDPNAPYTIPSVLSVDAIQKLLAVDKFFIEIIPETSSVEYEVSPMPLVLDVIQQSGGQQLEHQIKPMPDPRRPGQVMPPRFISQISRYGFKIAGSTKPDDRAVAVYHFTDAQVPRNLEGPVGFRFRAGIERGGDYDAAKAWSVVSLEVVNTQTRQSCGPVEFHPETNQETFVAIPGKYVQGGDFTVYVRGMDDGQWLELTRASVQLISAEHSFVLNLTESLLILWLLSVLVVITAIFTSTFVSWPIAVVLTIVILLGHWGVNELGDALNPGVGRSIATDFGFSDSTQVKLVSGGVDALAKLLTWVSAVLPDLSQFPVMDDITRGVSTPPRQVLEALNVLACWGLSMMVISFVILKNKEVAP